MSAGTLQRRVTMLEQANQGPPRTLQDLSQRQALRELFCKLRELVPDPAGSLQPVADMAGRIVRGRETEGDRAVMAALPAPALDALGMGAAEFMALLHSVDNAV